jgi:hypothetical protein
MTDALRLAVDQRVGDLGAAADHMAGRHAVDLFRKRAHQVDAAAGDDVGLEAVGAQVLQQFELWLVDRLDEEMVGPRVFGRVRPRPGLRGELIRRDAGVAGGDAIGRLPRAANGRDHIVTPR